MNSSNLDISANNMESGIQNIGWKFYLIFGVINFSFLPFIWYFYVETAGLSLEEIDRLFAIKFHGGSSMTYKEATRLAQEEIRMVREDNIKELKEAEAVQVSHLDSKRENP